jgi:hypothetical protein
MNTLLAGYDLNHPGQDSEADLRYAVAADIGDWFRFGVGVAAPVGTVGPAPDHLRYRKHDLGWLPRRPDWTRLRMTGRPEHVLPPPQNAIPEVQQLFVCRFQRGRRAAGQKAWEFKSLTFRREAAILLRAR